MSMQDTSGHQKQPISSGRLRAQQMQLAKAADNVNAAMELGDINDPWRWCIHCNYMLIPNTWTCSNCWRSQLT